MALNLHVNTIGREADESHRMGVTMKIKTKIEKVVSEDKTRLAICEPFFDGKNLYATNGHVLAVIPGDELEIDPEMPDSPGYVPVAAIKEARKQKNFFENQVHCNGSAKVMGTGAEYPRNPNDSNFPQAAMAEGFALEACRKKHITISINPELLFDLAQALGMKDKIKLDIPIDDDGNQVNSGFEVRSTNSSTKAHGVLMPLHG